MGGVFEGECGWVFGEIRKTLEVRGSVFPDRNRKSKSRLKRRGRTTSAGCVFYM